MTGMKRTSLYGTLAIALCVLAVGQSCVYFNTMYNARRLYKEAEELEAKSSGGDNRAAREKYKEVVVKCSKVLQNEPESSWVDDAIFLMGKALIRQADHNKGIRKFLELTTNFPESEYVPESLYWLALANFEKKEYNQALLYTQRFLNGFPRHELRHSVLFLSGDINLKLENDKEALSFYTAVSTEASEREIVEEAVLKSAELYYFFKDWEKAAENYGKLLRKGIPWERKYRVSLALADCYAKIEKCREALDIYDEILPDVPNVKDKGAVMLGRASSYVCMDSLDLAMDIYRNTAKQFPRSDFSAEAWYHMGIIYHEKFDSLPQAQEAFDMAGKESSSSPYSPLAQQKATSIKRLLELQKAESAGASGEQMAQRRFMAAEIQFTRLGEIDPALLNYRAVIDSFPESSYAAKAAYATGWIYKREKSDTLKAVEAFTGLISRYPRSQQAKGALEELFSMKADDTGNMWQAYIDSAMADTAAIAAELATRRASHVADSLAMAARHLPGRGSSQDPAADLARTQKRPAPREGDKAADQAGSAPAGEISASMMHMMTKDRFDRLRSEMWGTGAAAPDTSRAPDGR